MSRKKILSPLAKRHTHHRALALVLPANHETRVPNVQRFTYAGLFTSKQVFTALNSGIRQRIERERLALLTEQRKMVESNQPTAKRWPSKSRSGRHDPNADTSPSSSQPGCLDRNADAAESIGRISQGGQPIDGAQNRSSS